MGSTPEQWIAALGLQPHPEGGVFAETWRDPGQDGQRGSGTAIYYLLRAGEHSAWHRIDAAEVWHWYAGEPLVLLLWDGHNPPTRHVLGPDVLAGQRPQLVIPPGVWQAAQPLGPYALCGCTVSPAFDFAHFELQADLQVPGLDAVVAPDIDRFGRGAWQEDCDLPQPPTPLAQTAKLWPHYRWDAARQTVHGAWQFLPDHEGLPGYVHGGALSLLCDEAMGHACWLMGWVAPGAQQDVQFLAPARPGPARLEARVLQRTGRRLHCTAEVWQGETLLARARGIYISVPATDLRAFAGWVGVDR
jgi:predicted cupin superfamily sugar epimerase/acyl-coenzyme A thioesterase PaaI-like protein